MELIRINLVRNELVPAGILFYQSRIKPKSNFEVNFFPS